MEIILIVVAIVGLAIAIALFKTMWFLVSRAVDGLLDFAIYNFGNEEAVRRLTERRTSRNE